ncbi:MAG: hypothetical protein HZB66_00235 [Candidatus Aenigmarchaeota archaeon]|nr:hypothetical protein [Candidatus Aenigmarchaeota archaeon]
MVEFETLKAKEIEFGNNNFIEVARKKAKTEEGENTFISLSRGFKTPTGEKRYKKSFTIPLDSSVVKFVSENIKEMGKE